jgi:16S rRNA processing protein RimM
MNFNNKPILVAQVVSAHGINGAVKIRSYTEPLENILKYQLFFEENQQVKINHLFTKSPNLICHIDGIDDRNTIESTIGRKIFTLREYLPETNEDEFYITDLIKLPILNKNHEAIGRVSNVVNYGAGNLIEVTYLNNKSEIIEFTKKNFPIIDRDYLIIYLDS